MMQGQNVFDVFHELRFLGYYVVLRRNTKAEQLGPKSPWCITLYYDKDFTITRVG